MRYATAAFIYFLNKNIGNNALSRIVSQSKCDGSLVILEIVTIFHLLLLLESDFHIFFKLHEIYEKF